MKHSNGFFSSAKRRNLVIAIAAVVVVGGITTGAALSLHRQQGVFPSQVNSPNAPVSNTGATVDEETALQIALEHAGVAQSDAVVTKNHLDFDDGLYEYEIEFFANGKEYDYSISQTGEIRSYDIEQTLQQPSGVLTDDIGADAALQVALEHAGLSQNDIIVAKNKLDTDDGVYEYEIEFYAGGKEYDYTIHAQTGEIRSYDISTQQQQNLPGTASGMIDEATALQAALDQAGLQESEIILAQNHLDRDDGRYEYEIKFYANNSEYGITVDASTGAVLSSEVQALPQITDDAPAAGAYISQNAAYEAALADAGVSRDSAVLLKAELDRDDGLMEYEVEFFSNGTEYDYTLDAKTGTILSQSQEATR